MPLVRVRTIVKGLDSATGLGLITDYRRWPEASDAVRSVIVESQDGGWSTSHWEVVFRGGVMKWSERDHVDLAAGRETFELIEGDPHRWVGSWTARETDNNGCELRMDAEFDLGMPSLSHVLDPIAIEALEDAVGSVIQGLFGHSAEVEFGDQLTGETSVSR